MTGKLRSSRPSKDDVLAQLRRDLSAERAAHERTKAEAAVMRDWCAGWLIRARLAVYREGWEEGMSAGETTDALTSVLANLGCDDGTEQPHDVAETKRLLAMPVTYSPPAGRALAERLRLWRELHAAVNAEDWKHSGRVALVLAKLAALDAKETTDGK